MEPSQPVRVHRSADLLRVLFGLLAIVAVFVLASSPARPRPAWSRTSCAAPRPACRASCSTCPAACSRSPCSSSRWRTAWNGCCAATACASPTASSPPP
ncbi:hypothetical protein ACU686_28805 [Yinghuangia aomiensis]